MDFTTTAMARPEIVYSTYKSFNKRLKGIDLKKCKLFINIDPLPDNIDRREVEDVAKQFFGEVHANYPDKPNYTEAYNWIWSNASTEFIFNLEDDWNLEEDVFIPHLLENFKTHPNLMEIALRAYKYKYLKCPTSPSIMHERYYKAVGGNLNKKLNPETQLRGKNFGIEMPDPESGISQKGKLIVYPKNVILKDIGRQWLDNSGYQRPKKKCYFTSWEKK